MKKLLIILLFLILSCSNDKKKEITPLVHQSQYAIIIIEDNKENITTSIFKNRNLDNWNDTIHYFSKKTSDTLKIKLSESRNLYFSTKNNYRDTLFVSGGDTIKINLRNNFNILKHNNKQKKFEFKKNPQINILKSKYIKVSQKYPLNIKPTEFEKIKPLYSLKVDFEGITKDVEIINNLTQTIIDDLKKGNKYYDSISKSNYSIKSQIEQLKEDLKLHYFNDLITIYNFSKNDSTKNSLHSHLFIYDNLYKSNYSTYFIHDFINSIVLENKKTSLGHKIITDYNEAMNLLPKYFTDENLQLAQLICIESAINEEQSKESVKSLIKLYEKSPHIKNLDSYILNVKKNYSLDQLKQVRSIVDLKNIDGQSTSLDKIIDENSKEIIYIDFWASWCSPCREAMPSSKKIQEKYKNRNIKFVFISIDKNQEVWKKASAIEELYGKNNYLAINYPDADFYKDHILKTIPRYMIFYDGKLKNSDAPGPSSSELIKELEKYLVQSENKNLNVKQQH